MYDNGKLLKIFSPSCRKVIVGLIFFYGIVIGLGYFLNKENIVNTMELIDSYNKIIIFSNLVLIGLLAIYCLYIKLFHKYYIYEDKVIARTGVLKNTIIVPISNLMIINSYQTIPQFLLGLITVTIEADGDPNSPEIVMKDIPASIYEKYIMNFKHR